MLLLFGGAIALLSALAYANATAEVIDRATLASRNHTTWEGRYTFMNEEVLHIEGQEDLHILSFQCPGHEGTLIEFAQMTSNGKLLLLREADTKVKGVTPTLEGIDVLPDSKSAEILVRWHHPGQGGLRSIEKFRYSPIGLELIARSDFVGEGRKMKWIKERTSERSTPANLVRVPGTSLGPPPSK